MGCVESSYSETNSDSDAIAPLIGILNEEQTQTNRGTTINSTNFVALVKELLNMTDLGNISIKTSMPIIENQIYKYYHIYR